MHVDDMVAFLQREETVLANVTNDPESNQHIIAVLENDRKSEKVKKQNIRITREGNLFYSPPRIIKNDIRRHYVNMWVNTINSNSQSQVRDFLQTFCLPNCEHIVHNIIQRSNSFGNGYTTNIARNDALCTYDVGSLTKSMELLFSAMPDFSMQFSKVSIRRNSHYTGTIIETRCTSTATIAIPQLHERCSNDLSSDSSDLSISSDRSSATTLSSSSSSGSSNDSNVIQGNVLTFITQEIKIYSFCRIYVDENNRIYRFDVYEYPNGPSPTI